MLYGSISSRDHAPNANQSTPGIFTSETAETPMEVVMDAPDAPTAVAAPSACVMKLETRPMPMPMAPEPSVAPAPKPSVAPAAEPAAELGGDAVDCHPEYGEARRREERLEDASARDQRGWHDDVEDQRRAVAAVVQRRVDHGEQPDREELIGRDTHVHHMECRLAYPPAWRRRRPLPILVWTRREHEDEPEKRRDEAGPEARAPGASARAPC